MRNLSNLPPGVSDWMLPGEAEDRAAAKRKKAKTLKERLAKRDALAKLPLTDEEKTRWSRMLHDTWQTIGHDVEQAMRESGDKLTRAIIVETTLDANHVETYGGMTKEEAEFLSAIYSRPSFQMWCRQVLNY